MIDDGLGWLYRPRFEGSWPRRSLYSVAHWTNGLAFRTSDFTPDGDPIIKIAELRKGITSQTKLTRHEFDSRYRVRTGDLLFSWSGQPETSIGAFVWSGPDGWLNQHVFKVTPAEGVLDTYLRYLLDYLRPNFVGIARNKQTTGLGHVTKADLQAIEICLPPTEEQSEIATTLAVIDGKMGSNLQIIRDASSLARLVLQTGARTVRLGSACSVEKGLSYKGAGLVDVGGVPMANLANFTTAGWFNADGYKRYEGAYKAKHVVGPGDVLVANTDLTQRREILGQAAIVPPGADYVLFTHHVYALRFDRLELRLPVWAALGSSAFRERAMGFATGTTVAGLPKEALTEFEVVVPSAQAVEEADALLQRCWAAERETRTLQQLRDTLVPPLVSGQMSSMHRRTVGASG